MEVILKTEIEQLKIQLQDAELRCIDNTLEPFNLEDCQVSVHHELPHGGGTGNEFKEKLLVENSKWYTTVKDNSALGVYGWIKYKFSKPIEVRGFGLVSANDCNNRDPRDFKFLLKKDGNEEHGEGIRSGFEEFKAVEGHMFTERHQMIKFDLGRTVMATEALLLIDCVRLDSDGVQLSQF